MSDLISRQSAIDALLHNQEVYSNNFGDDAIDKYTVAIIDNDAQTIAQLPSAQPEIIRCKDCKWWKREENHVGETGDDFFCAFGQNKSCREDFYCADGERRSE